MSEIRPVTDMKVVDGVTDELLQLLREIEQEVNNNATRGLSSGTYLHLAVLINYELCRDYAYGTVEEIRHHRLISGISLQRSLFENMIDIIYIFKYGTKAEKRAEKYCKSEREYAEAVNKMVAEGKPFTSERFLQRVNAWSRLSQKTKIDEIDTGLSSEYDDLCYFTHPNPAAVAYYHTNESQSKKTSHTKTMTAFYLLFHLLYYEAFGNVSSLSEEHLKRLGDAIGFSLGSMSVKVK
jgi:hypothetical protein